MHKSRSIRIGWMAGGDARAHLLGQREAPGGHTPCARGGVDCVLVPSDGVLSGCAGRCAGGAGARAAGIAQAEKGGGAAMSVRMICFRAPRFLRGLIRLFVGRGN